MHAYALRVADAIPREVLEAAGCWEAGDRVPGRPEMTAFRQRVRLHHALWRESRAITEAAVMKRHPDWTRDQVRQETRRVLSGGRA
jgi:hypothetical protein